jgi:Domain of unknown function (DUF4440)
MTHHQDEEKSPTNDVQHLTLLNQRILKAEKDGDAETLAALLTGDYTIIRASGVRQDRQMFLDAVSANAHRGRTAEEPEIRLYRDCAVVIIRVTISEKQDGALTVRRFWNTRVFIRQEEQWRCATWQVTETRE